MVIVTHLRSSPEWNHAECDISCALFGGTLKDVQFDYGTRFSPGIYLNDPKGALSPVLSTLITPHIVAWLRRRGDAGVTLVIDLSGTCRQLHDLLRLAQSSGEAAADYCSPPLRKARTDRRQTSRISPSNLRQVGRRKGDKR
jgi:hypothetical protein